MKYLLDKSSRKYICPKCNKKRFVRFVETETNDYYNENYGRCDRESSCGYYKTPENNSTVSTLTNKTIYHPIETPSYHSLDLLQKSLQQFQNNNFYVYLQNHFSIDEIQKVFTLYHIGTSKAWQGASVLWQIDNTNNIRGGKILLFDKNTCKRVKEPYPHITWVHSKLKLKTFALKQCLFGLHLANSTQKIAITESEKTAIIMSLFLPEYTWMATGSKQNFKKELLLPIKNKEIVAFPDKSEFNDWQQKANLLNQQGFKIKVSDYIENTNCAIGSDLADIYIELRNKKPILKELTADEKTIVSVAKEYPDLLLLIETFDLLDRHDNPIDIGKLGGFL